MPCFLYTCTSFYKKRGYQFAMIPKQELTMVFTLLRKHMDQAAVKLAIRNKWDEIPKTPFTVLISCILSLRTKDEVTEEASIRLLSKYPTPDLLSQQPIEHIQSLIYPVGFYKTKAHRIIEISKTILKNYNGLVPKDFNALLSLKGVGRKTANIVMVYGFQQHNYLPIDTHCHRIPNRLGWVHTKTPDETEQQLRKILPEEYWMDFNHLIITFGKTICTPISPYCSHCPIKTYCKQVGVNTHR